MPRDQTAVLPTLIVCTGLYRPRPVGPCDLLFSAVWRESTDRFLWHAEALAVTEAHREQFLRSCCDTLAARVHHKAFACELRNGERVPQTSASPTFIICTPLSDDDFALIGTCLPFQEAVTIKAA